MDGSYNIATGEYGSGVIIIDGTEEICLKERGNDPGMAVMRNVAGEIAASEMAMKYAVEHGYGSIEIIPGDCKLVSWRMENKQRGDQAL